MKIKSNILIFYLQFFLISISIIAIYSFFNGYYLIQTQSNAIITNLSNYWIPFILPIIPIFFFFKKKLDSDNHKFASVFLISMISSICIIPAFITAQFYLNTALGKITYLENINQMNHHLKTKNYSLKNYYIDKFHTGYFYQETHAGKRSYDFEIYLVCPILESYHDTSKPNFTKWITKLYYKNFSGFDDDKIQSQENMFLKESLHDFQQANFNTFKYLKVIDFNNEFEFYKNAAGYIGKYFPKENNYFFEPVNQAFEDRNGHKLLLFFILFFAGQLLFFLILYSGSLF